MATATTEIFGYTGSLGKLISARSRREPKLAIAFILLGSPSLMVASIVSLVVFENTGLAIITFVFSILLGFLVNRSPCWTPM